ncbi:VPLPA-CTERM sorting domain-containing protein [Sneathiella sp.]|jgi:hypothetical protein|uniref:VPLPA-CTERM sorting domain-containing protein n=1 Tax=Sneathiella sp. TaxID=1964365 RepID=UPI0039E2CFC3
MKKILVACAFLLCTSMAAQAATFDFSGNGGLASSYSFTNDGVTVTTTPGVFSDAGTVYSQGRIGQYSTGLGISSYRGDSHQVDGNYRNDFVNFSFDQNVTIKSVSFSYVDRDDEFTFLFDLGPNGVLDAINYSVDIPSNGTYIFQGIWTGSLFGIGAFDDDTSRRWQRSNMDDFKISGMVVDPVISTVPLPAALPLYGAGIAILGFFGWRRKKRLAS